MDDEILEMEQTSLEVLEGTDTQEEFSQDTLETEMDENTIGSEVEEETTNDVIENTLSNDILIQILEDTGAIAEVATATPAPPPTLWNKPIEEYTTTEGLLLIIMFLLLARLIYDIIGGIICVK